ncbi:MAG: VWA domain-containing protein [Verrucomicrobiaceae bacterium]|nr:MAG: VWA domain-containing protein [Verrucomicrobiaceae bacterium]
METLALTFGSPLWLWGLLGLPVLAAFYIWSHLRGRALLSKVVAPRLRERLAGSVSVFRRTVKAVLVLAAFGLALVAMAQPRYGFIEREVKQKGRDIIVAVDTSRSMLATDIAPSRLARAKLLTQDLVRLLKGDRVGLVAFAGSAFLQAPLTLDYTAVINSLDELDTNVIPKGGTNIAAAIAIAEQAFGKAEGQTRALVILTDGEELDADGIAAARKAAAAGIRIFTVGIGSAEGSLIPFRSDEGKQDFVRDVSGKPVQSRLDEARLHEIAKETGGFYVPIGPDAAKEIFQKGIEPMDLAETGVFAARQPLERYQWPLGFAVAFLAIWLLLGDRRRISNGIRAAAFIAVLALPATSRASSGFQDYQAGNYEQARKSFESLLKSSPESREAQFDAGASSYKLNDFDQAIAHFTGSLLSENKKLHEDSAYNLGNALVRRGEAAKENDAKKADWKNAIEQYTEALKLNPKNKPAEENRAIVKKLLEDLEKQEKQQQDQKKDDKQKDQQNKDQKDQQKQDQKDQKQDQKNDQKQDQQNKDQQQNDKKDQQDQKKDDKQKDQQNKDQKDGQKGDEKKDQQKQDQKDSGQQDKQQDEQKNPQGGNEKKDEQKQGDQPKPSPTPTPGEKKEGDVKANSGGNKEEKKDQQPAGQAGSAGEEQEKEGEMSAAQARALLKSLNSEEEKVNLIPAALHGGDPA